MHKLSNGHVPKPLQNLYQCNKNVHHHFTRQTNPLYILCALKHRIGLLMHKLSNGNVPKPLQNLYKCNKNVHHHFTRQTNHFHSMRGNTEFVYSTFVFQSVFIWNTILQNINTNVSYARIYLEIFCYPRILPFDMTNKTQFQCPMTNFHLSFYHYA